MHALSNETEILIECTWEISEKVVTWKNLQ